MNIADSDLTGIANLMRRHIEIRNRSWLKRIHRDCFVGSEAVDFLVTQGFADSRKAAVEMGVKMSQRKLIRNISDSRKFSDSLHYYRFQEDDQVYSVLGTTNAGNGTGNIFGHGGCKWSFAPHTAHNSYILDIGLAEEIERAVAGASIEARAHAVNKLRSRVREQAEPDAPNWDLIQTTQVNNTIINIFQRKRPRGDWKNMKMTGVVAESPIGFIQSIMSFDKRKQWESMFEDGVVVEGIDIGEKANPIFLEEEALLPPPPPPTPSKPIAITSATPSSPSPASAATPAQTISLPESVLKQQRMNTARPTDDVYTFLQTVDLAGIPQGMAIAFLNDPERQHALSHLRKMMMLSNPQECMLCQTNFDAATDIRFCPCCAMVACAACVSKRVFEVVSRNVTSVCVHCYRESSRIFQPPQAVQDDTNIDESLRGKWWRPEELGIVDYSTALSSSLKTTSLLSKPTVTTRESVAFPSLYNDEDQLVLTGNNIRPLIPGLLDDLVAGEGNATASSAALPRSSTLMTVVDDEDDLPPAASSPLQTSSKSSKAPAAAATAAGRTVSMSAAANAKTARCKSCGMLISRDIEAIESHMEECSGVMGVNPEAGGSYTINTDSTGNNTGISVIPNSNHKQFAGIPRQKDYDSKYATRIIYRTARMPAGSGGSDAREICAFQDAFVDNDGTAYLYELSVRHSEVHGLPDYKTADVLLLLHVAKPIKGNKTASQITIINQIDTRTPKSSFSTFMSFTDTEKDIAGLRKEDLVRELQMCGNLPNLLNNQEEEIEESKVCLDDFELLAVLGRGGFGKVMQVRHKTSNIVYAMKILKKTELRRRRQVERTQTERTILANVQHPFIVCLHYAFQNAQKLYMVMDFVQGGDFFTFMKKYRRLPEDWVRLYILSVAMALQHLHDREIVYRDLKPENILLCADGYLKLTDFGLSRYFETRPPNPEDIIDEEKDDVVTRSFCGTEQYMSPEMLLQQGHNYRMDWWCLGLLMHEMITGKHPFHGNTHYETLRNMVTKPPTIDPRLSPPAAAIVKSLLIKNPRARLGGKEGIKELERIHYFTAINWDDLYHKRIEMPYKPKLQGTMDISSFEATFTQEKPIDSVPELDKKAMEAEAKRKGGKGLLGMFGLGANGGKNSSQNDIIDQNAFKGFSFTKDEDLGLHAGESSATKQ